MIRGYPMEEEVVPQKKMMIHRHPTEEEDVSKTKTMTMTMIHQRKSEKKSQALGLISHQPQREI
jgi:hypothetical protein